MVSIEKLYKHFEAPPLFEDFSYELAPGKTNILLGPSGCGKSTLLNMIASIDTDYSGTISGRPARIGIAFQDERLLGWESGRNNIVLVAPDIDKGSLDEIIRVCRINTFMDKKVAFMSGGERQRINLARALAYEPDLLLLDEPFRSLDISLRHSITGSLYTFLLERRKTALIVTHDVFEARELGDRITILKGSPATITADIDNSEKKISGEKLYNLLLED